MVMKLAIFLIVGIILLSGCIRQPDTVTEEEERAVFGYAGPAMDNLMQGFNDENYTRFSRDFGPVLVDFFTEDMFGAYFNETTADLGLYVSRSSVAMEKDEGLYTVSYLTEWEKKDNVTVELTFSVAGPYHKIQSFYVKS